MNDADQPIGGGVDFTDAVGRAVGRRQFRSSAPGGALGEPLSAMYSDFRSGLTLMPRGRLPTFTVATTICVAESMTLTSPEASFVTGTRRGGSGRRAG